MRHKNYRCSNCGVTMHSKDPATRSIFINYEPEEQALGTTFMGRMKPYHEGSSMECVELEYGIYDPTREESSVARALIHLRNTLSHMSDENIRRAACRHAWERVPSNGDDDAP